MRQVSQQIVRVFYTDRAQDRRITDADAGTQLGGHAGTRGAYSEVVRVEIWPNWPTGGQRWGSVTSAERSITKLRQVEVMTGQGTTMADAIRSIGVTEVTYYRWRSEYGGMKPDR